MAYKAEGKLHKIFPTEQKSDKFRAREFVIEVEDGKFPQMVKFQLVQDKCELLDAYQEGEIVAVDFDLRGREWNGKYFTNLNAWRVGQAGEAVAGPDSEGPTPPPPSGDFDDDIPF